MTQPAAQKPFSGIPWSEIAARLAPHIESICGEMLRGGKREGGYWVVGGVDGSAGKSCRVWLTGPKRGQWFDFATGEGGDTLELVAACLYRGDRKEAYAWGLHRLGETNATPAATRAAYTPEKPPEAPQADAARNRAWALRLWLSARPSLRGTPADAYLQARGIDLARLGRQPRALRFHPACRCTEAGADLPAMVAAVNDAQGTAVAVHRTWLAQEGGEWRKARLRDSKKTLGALHGGTIRLWRGATGKPMKDAPPGEVVALGEGIETCLSVAIACPELRVLCGVSLANMANVLLPPAIGRVILLGDNDGENPSSAAGLQRCINHFSKTFADVRIARAPIGKDFNDCLRVQ